MLRYGVLLASSLQLFPFFVLVFHLKQKHEERQRLLHYLRQTNSVLTRDLNKLEYFFNTILEFVIDFPIHFGPQCEQQNFSSP